MFIKFASGTVKQPFGANLMKTAVVLLISGWLLCGLSKLAALAIVIKVHKRHNETTIWCQFDENNINIFLNYRVVVVHLNFKTISRLQVLLVFIKIHQWLKKTNFDRN